MPTTNGAPPTDLQDSGAEPQQPDNNNANKSEEIDSEEIDNESIKKAQGPEQLSPDQIIEKAFQRTATWLGRRDQELMQNLGTLIDQKIASGSQPPENISSDDILENPNQWFEQRYKQLRTQETQNEVTFNRNIINAAARIMDNEPLLKDETLGKEVVEEVRKNFPQVNKHLPPQVAADLLVKNAITNVYRKRKSTKTNSLEKNKPTNEPLGTVMGGETNKLKSGQGPNISELASKMAKKWGYNEADLERVFGKE